MFMKRNAKWGCILRYLQAEFFILQKEYAIWKNAASLIPKHLKISLIFNVATQFLSDPVKIISIESYAEDACICYKKHYGSLICVSFYKHLWA